jgi:hypothetical protein
VIKIAACDHDMIGWGQFMWGWLSKLWEDAQENQITANATKWKCTSSHWMTNTERAVLEITRETWWTIGTLWKIQHIQSLDNHIQEEFCNWIAMMFLQQDHHLFQITMDHMIAEFLRERKEQWIKYSK